MRGVVAEPVDVSVTEKPEQSVEQGTLLIDLTDNEMLTL